MIPGSDFTTWSLAKGVEEEYAVSTAVLVCSSSVKGTPERIMRLFFVLILYFEDGCLQKKIH